MQQRRSRTNLLIIGLLVAAWAAIGLPRTASAQFFEDIVDQLGGAGSSTTVKDAAGNQFLVNVASHTTSATGETVTGTIQQLPSGTPSPFTVTETEETSANSTETISGTAFGSSFSCTFDTNTGKVTQSSSGAAQVCASLVTAGFSGTSPIQTVSAADTIATQGAVRSQTLAVTTIISDRVRGMSRDIARSLVGVGSNNKPGASFRGMSAGSADFLWGAWGDASGSMLRNNTPIGYDGSSIVALTGLDYLYQKSILFGLSAGYTHSDLSLRSINGPRVADGGVIGPYASYIISPNASVDAQFQYTRLSNRVLAPLLGIGANFGGNRFTGAINLNGYYDIGSWKLTGFTGYSYSSEHSESSILSTIPPFTSTVRYGVFKAGGEVGYQYDPQLEIYAPVTLLYETTTPLDLTSRFGVQVGAGLRQQAGDNFKLGVLVTAMTVKSHTKDVRIGANMRWSF